MITDQIKVCGVSFLKHFLDSPLAVLAGGTAFFLCLRCKERDHQFTSFRECIDVLFVEVNADTSAPEVTYDRKQGDRVTGEAADGFGDNSVDLAVSTILDHLYKMRTIILGAGVGFIGIDTGECPIAMTLDVFVVVADLGGE